MYPYSGKYLLLQTLLRQLILTAHKKTKVPFKRPNLYLRETSYDSQCNPVVKPTFYIAHGP